MQCIGWNGIACAGGGLEVLSMLQLLEDLEDVPATDKICDTSETCGNVSPGYAFTKLCNIAFNSQASSHNP